MLMVVSVDRRRQAPWLDESFTQGISQQDGVCDDGVRLCVKGMVEKWLLQVEETMIMSIRDVIHQSVKAYVATPRKQWVIEWPGQIVICVSSIYWTSEVTEAMDTPQGMQVHHILQLVQLGST